MFFTMPDRKQTSELFQNRYRIKSTRLPRWDYSQKGFYFVTICTRKNKHHFGKVKAGKMQLSKTGRIVQEAWLQTPRIRNYCKLDEWIIMPNHLHGIINLENVDSNRRDVAPQRLYKGKNSRMSKISPKQNSLPAIIRSFKSSCTRRINKRFPYSSFAWLPRYYDHIIRIDEEADRIREYIRNNPLKWEVDRNAPENLFT